MKTKELLSLNDLHDIAKFGQTLKAYINKNKLSSKIQGKDYAHVDGWKFAGANFGLTAIAGDPVIMHEKGKYIRIGMIMAYYTDRQGKGREYEKIGFTGYLDDVEEFEAWKRLQSKFSRESTKPHFAYQNSCDIIRLSDGEKIGAGVGFCENLETTKAAFDQYAIMSMAQTRSIGKAYRNLIGYIMNEAGYEGTPAEEMTEVKKEEEDKEKMALPEMTVDQFKKTMVRVEAKTVTLKIIEENYSLTETQRETVINALAKKL